MATQQPAAQTGRLRGKAPDIFHGDRSKSETFKQQFKVYQGINDNHEVMQNPYYRTMQALSLIKGPLVNDWVDDQITDLMEKVSRQQNPIPRTEPALWTDFMAAFNAAFTDTTKRQKAQTAIQQLRMRGDDLDSYVSTFRHIARDAEYALDANGTIHLFALGLKPGLLDAILHRDAQPNTMEEWITSARTEQQKYAHRQALKYPHQAHFQWVNQRQPPRQQRNGARRHPNDETVPMDVDQPVFTQVRRAYTEADKKRLQEQGRCFNCEKQGHMARECPAKKKQSFRSDQRSFRSDQQQLFRSGPSPSGSGQYFKKKSYGPPKRTQGFRKSNKPFKYTPQIRVAQIEEVEEEEEEEEQEEDVPSLAIRTARLSEDQREQWLTEMRDMGINF
jgi:hypothetical protein